jgi:hypothetical protein
MTPTTTRKPPAARPRARAGSALLPTQDTAAHLNAAATTIRQRNAARMLAVGHTQVQTAKAVGVHVRTIRKWCDEPQFTALVDELHYSAWTRIEPKVFASLELALDIEQEMLRGEVRADDIRYIEAARLIDKRLARFFDVSAAPTEHDREAGRALEPGRPLEGTVIAAGATE